MHHSNSRLATLLLAALLAPTVAADTINLSNGKAITDVTIEAEELLLVTYKDGNDTETVESAKVLSIEYDRKPQLVDRAEASIADQLYEDAIADLEEYIETIDSSDKELRRYKWAPNHAMHRLVVLHASLGNQSQVVAAADKLLSKAPDSLYVPDAFLKKAEAQAQTGKAAKALETLDAFSAVIDDKGLSERWTLERDLARLLYDESVQAGQRVNGLKSVIDQAGDEYPVVRNRARVAIANERLAGNKIDEAQAILEEIVDDPKADDKTLAAAHTGLGDCLFQKGVAANESGGDGSAMLKEALKHYMRVAVVYKSQVQYTPKALFFAGRCYQQFRDEDSQERAQRLYVAVLRDFGGSEWANQASSFRN